MTTWKERRDALRAQIETGDAKQAVLACLNDTNRRVRQEGLRRVEPLLGDPEVVAALTLRLNDRSLVVRRELAPLTPKIGLRAAPLLLELCAKATGEHLTLTGQALAALAEAHPDPALRQGAATLKRRAKGWFLAPSSRAALTACAARIEAATERVKDLPRGAGAAPSASALPTPASPPALRTENLPRPSDAPEARSVSGFRRFLKRWFLQSE